jgi:hypothetical protein
MPGSNLRMHKWKAVLFFVVLTWLVAACGGGGTEQIAPQTEASGDLPVANDVGNSEAVDSPEASEAAESGTPVSEPVIMPAADQFLVYGDQITAGWTWENSWGVEVAAVGGDEAYAGAGALGVTAVADYGGLFFSIPEDAAQNFHQNRFLGIRFRLKAGENGLDPHDLAIAVTGSNLYPYWSRETSSAPQHETPFTNEMGLPALGYQAALTPGEWVPVELWFQQMVPAPDHTFLTGFYLKNNADFRGSYYVDDVALIALPDNNPPVILSANNQTPTLVRLTFNEELGAEGALDPENYRVNGERPLGVEYDSRQFVVFLNLERELADGEAVSVQASNLQDLAMPANVVNGELTAEFTAVTNRIIVNPAGGTHAISPYIYGMAGVDADYAAALNLPLHSWGGNANSRYNWQLGNAWNAARDWYYINGNYGHMPEEGSISDKFARENEANGVASLLTVPMVGWVAKDTESCAFPQPDGSCGDAEGRRLSASRRDRRSEYAQRARAAGIYRGMDGTFCRPGHIDSFSQPGQRASNLGCDPLRCASKLHDL